MLMFFYQNFKNAFNLLQWLIIYCFSSFTPKLFEGELVVFMHSSALGIIYVTYVYLLL